MRNIVKSFICLCATLMLFGMQGAQAEPLNFKQLIQLDYGNNQNWRIWAYEGARDTSKYGDYAKFGEPILSLPEGRSKVGADLMWLENADDPAATGQISEGSRVKVVSFAGGFVNQIAPNYRPYWNESDSVGRVWVAVEGSRWEKGRYGEIVIMRRDQPEASDPNKSVFTIRLEEGKTGPVSIGDKFALETHFRLLDQGKPAEMVWYLPTISRLGSGFGEVLIGPWTNKILNATAYTDKGYDIRSKNQCWLVAKIAQKTVENATAYDGIVNATFLDREILRAFDNYLDIKSPSDDDYIPLKNEIVRQGVKQEDLVAWLSTKMLASSTYKAKRDAIISQSYKNVFGRDATASEITTWQAGVDNKIKSGTKISEILAWLEENLKAFKGKQEADKQAMEKAKADLIASAGGTSLLLPVASKLGGQTDGIIIFSEKWKAKNAEGVLVTFQARGLSDIGLIFASKPEQMSYFPRKLGSTKPSYEIWIGAWGNRRITIHKNGDYVRMVFAYPADDPTAAERNATFTPAGLITGGKGLGDGTTWDYYWVRLLNGEIRYGKGKNPNDPTSEITRWQDPAPIIFSKDDVYVGIGAYKTDFEIKDFKIEPVVKEKKPKVEPEKPKAPSADEKKISDLKVKIADLKKKLENKALEPKDKGTLEKDLKVAEAELEKLTKASSADEKKISDLKVKIADLKKKLEDKALKPAEKSKLQRDLKAAEKALAALAKPSTEKKEPKKPLEKKPAVSTEKKEARTSPGKKPAVSTGKKEARTSPGKKPEPKKPEPKKPVKGN